ncbi:MAG: YgaP family membrane protein [Flavobacteriales bacterium]
MKTNMGAVDRWMRFSLALAMGLLIYYNVVGGFMSYALLAVIGVFALTGLVGFCPFYSVLGWNTFSHRK